jgi:hypothetical protein
MKLQMSDRPLAGTNSTLSTLIAEVSTLTGDFSLKIANHYLS